MWKKYGRNIGMIVLVSFLLGLIWATKGFEPRLEFEIMALWDKILSALFVIGFAVICFEAGKEYEKGK